MPTPALKLKNEICLSVYLCRFHQWRLLWRCHLQQPHHPGSPPGLSVRWAEAVCTHETCDHHLFLRPVCSEPGPAQTGKRAAAGEGGGAQVTNVKIGRLQRRLIIRGRDRIAMGLPGLCCSWVLRGSRGSGTAGSPAVSGSRRGRPGPACRTDTRPPPSSCSPRIWCSGSGPTEQNKAEHRMSSVCHVHRKEYVPVMQSWKTTCGLERTKTVWLRNMEVR